MPEFVNGLPLHALVVHAVVVLIPLAVLGGVVISVWAAARRRYGWLVVACAAAGAVLTPVAVGSGEDLERRLPAGNPLIETHEELGRQLIWFVLPLFLAVTALMVVHTIAARATATAGAPGEREGTAAAPGWTKIALIAAAVVTIGFAGASAVQVFRVGEAGTRAVWDGFEDIPPR